VTGTPARTGRYRCFCQVVFDLTDPKASAAPTWRVARSRSSTINLGAIYRRDLTDDLDLELPRKEVIQPHLPVRLPCYDFVPITDPTFDGCLLAVGPPASGVADFHDVTGGVYKAREHIHRRMLTGGY
jgi:hypothetical protein